jgi:hypothetical protein
MASYQLCLGNQSLGELIERIATDATAVAPGLGRGRARQIAEVLFRSRVRQTVNCGRAWECADCGRAVWGDRLPAMGRVPPCQMRARDPYDLPNIFAAALGDSLEIGFVERCAVEERLASVFRCAMAPHLFRSEHCGRSAVCLAAPRDPFAET